MVRQEVAQQGKSERPLLLAGSIAGFDNRLVCHSLLAFKPSKHDLQVQTNEPILKRFP